MAEKALNRAHVRAVLQQVRGERVPQSVKGNRLLDPRSRPRPLKGLLRRGGMQRLLPALPPGKRIVLGFSFRQYARRVSRSEAESITYRSFRPLPCSTRITIRWLSMSVNKRWTTSPSRMPVA